MIFSAVIARNLCWDYRLMGARLVFLLVLCFPFAGCDKESLSRRLRILGLTSYDMGNAPPEATEAKRAKKPKVTPKTKVDQAKTLDGKTLAEAGKRFAQYRNQAETLVADIKAEKPVIQISELAGSLTQTGLEIAPTVVAKYPGCKAYLEAVILAAPTMHTLPLAEIESGYHKDGKLPKNSQGECYHAKDLVVHPATVVALAKAGLASPEARSSAQEEIAEVLTHLGQLKTALGIVK